MTTTTDDTSDDYGQFAPSSYAVAPLGDPYVRFFAGFRTEPGRHGQAVTHDVLVDQYGDVQVQINGTPLEDLPDDPEP